MQSLQEDILLLSAVPDCGLEGSQAVVQTGEGISSFSLDLFE